MIAGIEKDWWTKLVNSVRFLNEIEDQIFDYEKSVILFFDDNVPWQDTMIEEIETRLSTDSRTVNICDVSENTKPVGQYLFDRFYPSTKASDFWRPTHHTYEQFLATRENLPFNNMFVVVHGIPKDKTKEWFESVNLYLENCTSEQHAVFILIANTASMKTSNYVEPIYYNKYVSDYDCMMLCLTIVSSFNISRAGKIYLSEVASGIAKNNVEIAGLLAQSGDALIKDPLTVTRNVYSQNGIQDPHLKENVDVAVWDAQIRILFPKIEEYRSGFIKKYMRYIDVELPIENGYGEKITKATDVEIGLLYYIFRNRSVIAKEDLNKLGKMRDMRNRLAHRDSISYKQLRDLNII